MKYIKSSTDHILFEIDKYVRNKTKIPLGRILRFTHNLYFIINLEHLQIAAKYCIFPNYFFLLIYENNLRLKVLPVPGRGRLGGSRLRLPMQCGGQLRDGRGDRQPEQEDLVGKEACSGQAVDPAVDFVRLLHLWRGVVAG